MPLERFHENEWEMIYLFWDIGAIHTEHICVVNKGEMQGSGNIYIFFLTGLESFFKIKSWTYNLSTTFLECCVICKMLQMMWPQLSNTSI